MTTGRRELPVEARPFWRKEGPQLIVQPRKEGKEAPGD